MTDGEARERRPANGGAGARSGSAPPEERPPGRLRWDLFLLVAAGLLLIGQARVHVFVPGASALRPALLLAVLGLGLWFIQRDPLRSILRLRDPVSKTACFFLVWIVATVPLAAWPGGSLRYILGDVLPTAVVFLVVAAAIRNIEDVRRMLATLAVGVGVFAYLAPARRTVRGFGAGGYDPNDSAMLLTLGIPVLVYFTAFGRHALTRIAAGLGILLAIFGIVDTQSRGGVVGLAAVLVFLVLMLRGIHPVIRGGAVAVMILGMIPVASSEYWERMETIRELDDGYGQDSDIGGRRNIWSRGVGYWSDNPVTGLGINNYRFAEGRHPLIRARIESGRGVTYRTAHSQWIQTLAELGAVGAFAFLLLFYHGVGQLRRLQRNRSRAPPPMKPREFQVMVGALLGSLVGVIVAGSFLSNAYGSMIWGVFAICVGLLKVMAHSGSGNASPAPAGGSALPEEPAPPGRTVPSRGPGRRRVGLRPSAHASRSAHGG